ncbi:FHA domain-containing protein [Microbacterium yannicii]|uniref:FHA domain-containing protein n=1 Tax=Microbacterium yannicii TaxID=671622 RepID=UPI0003112632|nr:FHA domain-containing protein [Microbacterium yannicii]
MPTLYAPGETPVAVTPRGFVVLDPETPHTLAARIRALVADGRGLGGVIEALTGAYGTSLTAIPPFGVALADGGGAVRIAARGDIAFDVDATAPERVSGAGVTTWTERLVPGATRVTFATADALPAELPAIDAVVLAAVVEWDVVERDAAAPRPSTGAVGPAAAVVPGESAPPATLEVEPAPPAEEPAAAAEDESAVDPEPAVEAADERSEPTEPKPAELEPTEPEPSSAPAPAIPDAAVPRAATPPVGSAAASVPAAAPAPMLIDSNAVLSLTETLLPADSTIAGHTDRGGDHPGEGGSGAGSASPLAGNPDDAEEPWAATVVRGGNDTAGAPAAPEIAGDHDGETISLAQARALRGGTDPSTGPSSTRPAGPGTASPITSPLAPPRPPAPGRVRLSTGQVVTLDRTIVIGRRPRSTRVSGTDLPHLVAVDSPQQDISRSHVELRAEGESIVATDLRTTNGTTLLRAGSEPMRLHPGEGTVVVPGDVLDLGDGITVAIEAVS